MHRGTRKITLEAFGEILERVWELTPATSDQQWGLELIHSQQASLILNDAERTVVRWVIEGIADPRKYAGIPEPCLAFILRDSREYIERFLLPSAVSECETARVAKVIAKRILDLVKALNSADFRRKLTKKEKQILLDIAGSNPRCWLTGFAFSEAAIHQFLEGDLAESELPFYVDVLTPIGLNSSDLLIEIDHIKPFSKGGSEDIGNLRLSCGWANRAKSSQSSLFDSSTTTRTAVGLPLGLNSLPNPFWAVRTIGTVRVCQEIGCTKTVNQHQLRVALTSEKGAPTPTNLKVVCREHDPWESARFVPRTDASIMWQRRTD